MMAGAQNKAGEADLIFHGGRIYTVDARRSWAQAVAVRGGKIAAVSSDAERIAAFLGELVEKPQRLSPLTERVQDEAAEHWTNRM